MINFFVYPLDKIMSALLIYPVFVIIFLFHEVKHLRIFVLFCLSNASFQEKGEKQFSPI